MSDEKFTIYVTDIPSFYKINLYNEIGKHKNIFVFFLESQSNQRNRDFYDAKISFPYVICSSKKEIIQKFIFGILTQKKVNANNGSVSLKKNNINEFVIDGWNSVFYYLAIFLFPKNKNSLIVESSIFESKIKGIKALIKKIFLSRISKVYVPGESNKKLLEALNFKGQILKTYGVGVQNFVEIDKSKFLNKEPNKNFLFVGRLSPEKNLDWLITQFKKHPDFTLTIVGFGPDEEMLKNLSDNASNIKFIGAVNNRALGTYFKECQSLVLPSRQETWGLVVEESYYYMRPVLVSDRVGCAEEIVLAGQNGYIFQLDDEKDFWQKAELLSEPTNYKKMITNLQERDYSEVLKKQVNPYL